MYCMYLHPPLKYCVLLVIRPILFQQNVQRMFRKKTIMGPLQKSLKKRPRPPPRKPPAAEPDEDIYENQPSRVR